MTTRAKTKHRAARPAGDVGIAGDHRVLLDDFRRVRAFTETLAEPLETEDFVVQTMESVSPTKWHLAHTSWFFEVFVLQKFKADYRLFNPDFPYLFNSYYVQAGERHCRDRRGYISRPTVKEVYAYRAHVDEQMEMLLQDLDPKSDVADVVEIGIHHEQQHQELILTDIKHVLSVNPLRPVYRISDAKPAQTGNAPPAQTGTALLARAGYAPPARTGHGQPVQIGNGHPAARPLAWKHFDDGLYEIGHTGAAFSYDNETPRHRHFAHEFLLTDRLVTNGEYLEFMQDGGYRRPELWLSEGWATVAENNWTEPFYWEERDGTWWMFTLSGMREVADNEPVCHLSFFEADAYARWADARLPTEQEWEIAARSLEDRRGNFVEAGTYHPAPAGRGLDQVEASPHVERTNSDGRSSRSDGDGHHDRTSPEGADVRLQQMYGDVWEWTRSQYSPYPGYKPLPGALGEYNGKFMCNQFVLRGGSCATSETHIRPTYRNFFPPQATWQFTGFRLARDV